MTGTHKLRARLCHTCNHPDRERIEQELAIAHSVASVAKRYGIHERADMDAITGSRQP